MHAPCLRRQLIYFTKLAVFFLSICRKFNVGKIIRQLANERGVQDVSYFPNFQCGPLMGNGKFGDNLNRILESPVNKVLISYQ